MSFAASWNERLAPVLMRARTYDRTLLSIAGALLFIGVVLAMATSPAASARMELDQSFAFALRQAAYAGAGIVVILLIAGLDPRGLRRLSLILIAVMLPLCLGVGLWAPEVKGASRWLDFGPFSLQPSELLKPALVMFWAWMLSERMRHPRFAGVSASLALFALTAGALVTQPDIGQTVLLLIVMTMMFALAGVDWRWLAGIGAAGAGGFAALYSFFPHVRARVDAFLFTEPDSGTQVGRALDAIASGGLFGRGPGEGVIKRHLPDAHADFVYAVGAEEFGLIVSIGIVAIFGALAFRGLSRAARLNEAFEQLAATGLIALLVTQAAIHVAVNLSLLPAKGMTLPFISFGGSSMMGSALAMGACVSLLRNRPGAFLFGRSP